MSQANPYQSPYTQMQTVAQADLVDRLGFIRRTYFHLTAAIIAVILIEFFLFNVFPDQLAAFTGMVTGYGWFIVLGAFILVSWIADRWAHSGSSRAMQYAGLGLYVVAQSVILAPLLFMAYTLSPGSIEMAGILTAVIFGVLTIFVFVTRQDFSFLRNFLMIGGFGLLGIIVASILFPGLGMDVNVLHLMISGFGVVLATGYILYQTSNIIHHYHSDQHVAASLGLFASVALLFWYILQLVAFRD